MTDQTKTAREWSLEYAHAITKIVDDGGKPDVNELRVQYFALAMAQAREAALTEAIAVCREIEARDLGGTEWLHARRCAAAIDALRAQPPTEGGA